MLYLKPIVVLDGAHNPDSTAVMVSSLKAKFPTQRIIGVFGASADKDIKNITAVLKDCLYKVVLTKSDQQRAHAFCQEEAKQLFGNKVIGITTTVNDALELAQECAKDDDVILVTGSLYIVAQAREHLLCIK